MQNQITELEIKVAHLEQAINELSDVMYAQQGQIDGLDKLCTELGQRLQDSGDSTVNGNPGDEKPPHY
jgi:uncharacterized coiled-coil protein SlyX